MFWPLAVERIVMQDGTVYLGEVAGEQSYVPSEAKLAALAPETAEKVRRQAAAGGALRQQNIRIENFELTNEHFVWVDELGIQEATFPEWAVVVERLTNGRFYGTPVGFLLDGTPVAGTAAEAWQKFGEYQAEARQPSADDRRAKKLPATNCKCKPPTDS